MSKTITSTGWFGIPGRDNPTAKVHMIADGLPVCGARPKGEYQWCAPGANYQYTDCLLCRQYYDKYEAGVYRPPKPPRQRPIPNKRDKWVVLNGRPYMRLVACPRCGRGHSCLAFKPLAKPEGKFTHWTVCPRNQQPILKQL